MTEQPKNDSPWQLPEEAKIIALRKEVAERLQPLINVTINEWLDCVGEKTEPGDGSSTMELLCHFDALEHMAIEFATVGAVGRYFVGKRLGHDLGLDYFLDHHHKELSSRAAKELLRAVMAGPPADGK